MSQHKYTYTIIGGGASGLHLAIAMSKDSFFKNKSVVVIDKSTKNTNDKSFSFWEKESGKWDEIVTKKWSSGQFSTKKECINLHLGSYKYKLINSLDFYNYAKTIIGKNNNITLVEDDVKEVQIVDGTVNVFGKKTTYSCHHVFDSRIPETYDMESKNFINIKQHFKGWLIQTADHQFDIDSFVMMDYSVKAEQKTGFTYVLPIAPDTAMIEYTYFTPNLVAPDQYVQFLKKYIKEQLGINSYKILHEEFGIIPMTTFPFEKSNTEFITKIGTAGGWVRPSTGYSFKNCERNSLRIIAQLKNGKKKLDLKRKLKFYHYDKIMLDVLDKENEYGEKLFYKLYKNNNIQRIFRFLDEESSLWDEFRIVLSLTSLTFIRAFLRHLKKGFKLY